MAQPTTQTPPGWHVAGTARTAYVAGVDPNVRMGVGPSGYLKSTKRTINGFGTLMQGIAPDNYVGGRIRASCYLKTGDVSAWAALWVRVDGDRNAPPIAFDNMEERAVKGTTDWTECVVVLDVGPGASNITFGVLLSGTGTVWIDRMKFEAVDQSVPVTGSSANRADPEEHVHARIVAHVRCRGVGQRVPRDHRIAFLHENGCQFRPGPVVRLEPRRRVRRHHGRRHDARAGLVFAHWPEPRPLGSAAAERAALVPPHSTERLYRFVGAAADRELSLAGPALVVEAYAHQRGMAADCQGPFPILPKRRSAGGTHGLRITVTAPGLESLPGREDLAPLDRTRPGPATVDVCPGRVVRVGLAPHHGVGEMRHSSREYPRAVHPSPY